MDHMWNKWGVLRQIVPLVFVGSMVMVGVLQYQSPKFSLESKIKSKTEQEISKGKTESEIAHLNNEAGTFQKQNGVYKGTGRGYGGEIKVAVTINNNKIIKIEVLSAKGEDEAFFIPAKGVMEEIITTQKLDVDVISGATYSSKGIMAAVEDALYGISNQTIETTSSKKEVNELSTIVEKQGYKDGTYIGEGQGFGGNVTVQVKIVKGKIKKIRLLRASGEDMIYLKKAKTLFGIIVNKQSTNVDVISGATYSSNGIIAGVRDALSKA